MNSNMIGVKTSISDLRLPKNQPRKSDLRFPISDFRFWYEQHGAVAQDQPSGFQIPEFQLSRLIQDEF